MVAAEADFQRFYNLDLDLDSEEGADEALDRLGVRRLWGLLFHMPPEGAWKALMRDRHGKPGSPRGGGRRIADIDELARMLGQGKEK